MKTRRSRPSWRRLRTREHSDVRVLSLINDEDFIENLEECVRAFNEQIYPVLIPSGSSGIHL